MTQVIKGIKGILLFGLAILVFSSCESLFPNYEVQVGNDCQKDGTLMGETFPMYKFHLDEVKVGDHTFTDISLGEYSSNTETVKAGDEYEVSVTYTVYEWELYDNAETVDDGQWVETDESTKTFDETLTFASNLDHEKYSLDFYIGDIISNYDIKYERYYVDE
ncbi:MAG: hypothetical protein R6V32_00970 [Bacteroidales bacterium]